MCKKWWLFAISGVAFNLFSVDGSQPWWSAGARDCSHVQDGPKQVWDNCKELDPEVCHGLGMLFYVWGQTLFPSNTSVFQFYVWMKFDIPLVNPKMDKKERSRTCPQLKRRKNKISAFILFVWVILIFCELRNMTQIWLLFTLFSPWNPCAESIQSHRGIFWCFFSILTEAFARFSIRKTSFLVFICQIGVKIWTVAPECARCVWFNCEY